MIMKEALFVTSSAQGDSSVSEGLVRILEDALRLRHPELNITRRDVGREPLPHLVAETVAGIRAEPRSEAEKATRALSDALIDELRSAELIVITSPMYNFGMSSTLKTWFDHVLRARATFRYTEKGPEGLLRNKKAVVIETRAGLYSQGPSAASDSQEPHLRTLLAFMGIEDVEWVRVEGLAFGPEAAERAIEQAGDHLRGLFGTAPALAA
jgi:FMN-dependent NADH-azoreductase